jgi:putative transposase
MKRSRYTEEQIAFALKQAELGTPVPEVCRKMGISDATFYTWRKKYGGLGPSELRRLKQLEEENARLKRMVADLSLDKTMLQDVLSKNSEAFPQAGVSRRTAFPHWGQRAAGVCGSGVVAVGVSIPVRSPGCPCDFTAHPGDYRDLRALRLSAGTCAIAAGRLARQSQTN